MLDLYSDQAWSHALDSLLPGVHPVDRNATRIWFHIFPLRLARALATTPDPAALAFRLQLRGRYRLHDQIDTSHGFLYGHRYWPAVKAAIAGRTSFGDPEADARAVAASVEAPEELALGITAVGLMTLQQVGSEAFRATPGEVHLDPGARALTPEQVLSRRARDDRQRWLFKILRGDMRKRWTIAYNEARPDCRYFAYDSQHLTTAAAADPRALHAHDPRCMPGEGPIPVECRIAACGTCWVGVIGGAEKLSEVQPLERTRMRAFGYIDTDEPRPLIRLACMAQAFGAVSIIIPPWNGYLDRYLDEPGQTYIAPSSADGP